MKFSYDLHVHSCLSPCADDDMTPFNIAGMAYLKGLNIVALTDHNTCKNCPPFFAACEQYGITPIAGMELTTAEDIHLICLFKSLEDALRFSDYVYERIIDFKNDESVFGNQIITDKSDNESGREEKLLITATDMDIYTAVSEAKSFGAAVYPAHIDRRSNGIIAVLGDFPSDIGFVSAEFNDYSNRDEYIKKYPIVNRLFTVCSSDAHSLERINEAENFIELAENTAENVINCLKNKI